MTAEGHREHVAEGRVADALAEAQARFPSVPVMFAETRPLAQEWAYRFLGAALSERLTCSRWRLLLGTALTRV